MNVNRRFRTALRAAREEETKIHLQMILWTKQEPQWMRWQHLRLLKQTLKECADRDRAEGATTFRGMNILKSQGYFLEACGYRAFMVDWRSL